VLRAALSSSGDPALGLRMGGQASTGKFDVLASGMAPSAYRAEH
jgi:hypothetical protein